MVVPMTTMTATLAWSQDPANLAKLVGQLRAAAGGQPMAVHCAHLISPAASPIIGLRDKPLRQ